MNRRVLLIDADPAFRDTLTKELGRYRVEVTCEPEADRALQLGTGDPPDLLVIGVDEPEKAGFRAFQKAKKGALGKTPVVLVTSSVAPDSFAKHKGLKVHADEYIDKRSMTQEELIAKIDNLIGLGDLQEDELGVAVDDDIPMELADGDVVLDETVGEEDEPAEFDDSRTVGPGEGVRADSMISAETDAAFDALMGDEPSATAAPEPVADEASAVPEPVPHPSAPEPVEDEISAVPEPVPHPSRPDSGVYPEQSSDFADEEPVAQVEERDEPVERNERIEAPDRMQSQPAIPIDDEELVPMEDELPVEVAPEDPAPEPAKPAEEATVMREPVIPDQPPKSAMHAVVDLGLDAIAQDADREQSGVYDRKALRKISDLERQLAQLKQELERARAQADTAAKGGGRETQFLKLREQLDAKDKELKQAKTDLATSGGKLAELEKKLEQVQHTKDKLDAKNKELEQRIFESGDRSKELEGSAQQASARADSLQQALDAKTKELADAQAAHAEALQALRVELSENYAAAGEDSMRAALADSEKKHQKDLINLKADQAGELKRVRGELGGELARVKDDLGGKVARLESELAQLVQKHEAELAARDEEHEEARERDAQSHGQALAQLKQELDHARASHDSALAAAKRELEQLVAQHEDHKGQLHQQHRGELAAAAHEHAQELAAAAHKHEQELAALAEQHGDHHAALVQAHAQELAAATQKHEQELAAATQKHEQELAASAAEREELFEAAERAAETHRAALAEAKAAHTAEVTETRERAAREASEQRAALAATKRAAEEAAAQAEAEREALEQQHADQLAELQAKHERAIAVANGDFLKQKSVADAEHQRAIAALKAEADRQIAELEAEREELRRGLSGARDTLKRTESELQSAMETISERNDELRAHQAAIAERDQRIADLRAEIEGLLQENTSYQDQVLRAYQKIKSDEAMVARARKAMAIALTVLDDEGNPTA